MTLEVITQPTDEPVTLEEAKQHLRVSVSDDDSYIEMLISAARGFAENFTGRAFMTQTIEYTLDTLSGRVFIPRPKLQSITWVRYSETGDFDTDVTVPVAGSPTVISDFQIRYGEPASIYPAYNGQWPTIRFHPDSVRIRYVAGYGDNPEDVPAPIRHAILMLVGHWFEHRESVNVGNLVQPMDFAHESLLLPYRIYHV